MKPKKSYRWLVLMVLALILIAVSLWHLLPAYLDRWKSAKDYEELAREYVSDLSEDSKGSTKEEKEKKKDWWLTDVKVEFDKLKKENPDIIAWLRFDNQKDLGISYPVLYSGDNKKYLHTDFHGESRAAGSIFLEGLNQPDFSDYYNIIYGHNMRSGSMFGSLKKYKEKDFWKKNQYFTVYTEETVYRYQIFSYEDAVNGGDVYKVGYKPGKEYEKFIAAMVENSDIKTGIEPQTGNKILTLSTCTGNGYSKRFAIHAVCVDAQTTDTSKLEVDEGEKK